MRVVIMMFIATLIGCSSISGKKPVSWDAFAGYTDESEMKFCSNLDVLDKSQCVTDLKAYKKANEACKENASCMFLNEQNWKSFVQIT